VLQSVHPIGALGLLSCLAICKVCWQHVLQAMQLLQPWGLGLGPAGVCIYAQLQFFHPKVA
jgi:hypothetical protein